MEGDKEAMLATGQGESDVSQERAQSPNIFDRITQMGNSTVTSDEMRVNEFAASLETMSASMAAMKRDLDILRQGQHDLQGDNRKKRARITEEDDCISTSSRESDGLLDRYLDESISEGQEGETPEWEDIGDYFENSDETGEEIETELANLANKVLRSKPKEEKIKSLAAKHKRPRNVENLQVPKVEEQLWRQLKRDTKAFDYGMQKTQSSLCQAMVPVLKMMQVMKGKPISQEIKELAGDTWKILAQAVVQSNEARGEKIKRDLLPAYKPLCGNKPSATRLFGDKLQDDIKSLKESKTSLTSSYTQKKPFLLKRGGTQYNQYRNNQGSTYSPRQNKPQAQPVQFRNQQSSRRGKPMRK